MKKYCFVIIVLLLVYVGCTDEVYLSEMHWIPVNIRNMSTVSGVTLTVPHLFYFPGDPWGGFSVSLDPSPQPGVPVDSSSWVYGPHGFPWSVERAIDSVVFDSGSVFIDSEKWVVIYGDSTGWNCVWYNSGW